MNYFLHAAAAVAGVTFCVHTFIGGYFVVRPLLAQTKMPNAAKWLCYYCWHVTTVMIAFTATGYAWAARTETNAPLAAFLSLLTACVSVLSVAVALKGRIHPLRFPSTYLFAMTSLLGWVGIAV